MRNHYDVIVVGGGLAGLTAAAYLAKEKRKVLLCEKQSQTGGLVGTFWHKDFAFDSGIRAFENSGIVFPMLKDLGINIEFVKNEVSIGISNKSIKLTSKDNLIDYQKMLSELFPENQADIKKIMNEIVKVMHYMDVIYAIDNPLFIQDMKPKYLLKTLLPWYLKYQINITKASKLNDPINSYLSTFTNNKALIDMITQHFFKDTPAFFALSYFSLYLNYSYPLNGTGLLAKKVSEFITTNSGEILTNAEVVEVNVVEKFIKLSNGNELYYDKLVWAANQKTLYNQVSNFSSDDFIKQKEIINQSRGGDSVLTLFLGVDKETNYFKERCGAHMFYTPTLKGLSYLESYKNKNYSELKEWMVEYLENTTYEISCPAIRDHSLAPHGKSGVIISTLMDYDLIKEIERLDKYQEFKDFCTQKIIQIFNQTIFYNFQESILFSFCATPLTIEKETSNSDGAITGWSFTNQVMPSVNHFKKITHSIYTPIKDVYQCGQWTFSPSGLPVSILTGKLVADEVIKNIKKTKR